MSLTPGTRLGPYEVTAPLGAGGMGEVFRGRDTSLNRDVAIKVLPAAVAGDADRLARFEREAQALAALNHPNIAHIYGLEKSGQTPAIVMEFVGGEDLSARITGGAVPLAEALPLARQIADALAAAHEAGIIHRDLKPANIKVTDDGTVKVLDFGLAKALDSGTTSGASDAANSPTLTNRATQMGVILGTAAYMAPEQARGRNVDKRADIWAFGVVLYEMLTGRRLFDASDISDVLAYVLTKEPDWDALPAGTPPPIRRVLRRCLAKDPKERLHDIADARLELGEPMVPGGETAAGAVGGPPPANAWTGRRVAALAAVLVLGGLAIGGAIGRWSSAAGDPLVTYALLDVLPAEEVLAGTTLSPTASAVSLGGYRTALAWSPDGKTLAFVGRKDGVDQLYLRDLASAVAKPLEGTDGASWPVFSPDGREVAFAAKGAIWKMPVDGGPRSKIADRPFVNGLAWGATQLIFAGADGLYSVPSGGGTPRQLTEPATSRQVSPHLLPGDRAVLYTEHDKRWTSGDERVMVLPLEAGSAPRVLLPEAADARYLPKGQLAFLRQGTLFVVPFDPEALTVHGEPTPVLTNVAQTVRSMGSDALTLAGQFAVSPLGTLAYVSRPLASFPDYELVLVDRAGRVEPIGAPVRPYFGSHLGLEPNGTRIAVTMQMENAIRLGIWDTGRRILAPSPASLAGEIDNPVWSSRGDIAFIRFEGPVARLALYRPDAQEPPEDVADSLGFNPSSWSSDGRRLAGTKDGDVWIFSPDENPKLRPFVQTPDTIWESSPSWSPDDRWLAYEARTEGGVEVWVKESAGSAPPVLVSTNRGRAPAWNPSAPELFYVEPHPGAAEDQVMMAVDIRDPRRPGIPKPLFSFSSRELRFACSPTNCYSVRPGGQQFYASRLVAKADAPVTHVNIVLNWFKDVERKLPQ